MLGYLDNEGNVQPWVSPKEETQGGERNIKKSIWAAGLSLLL